MCLLFLGMKIDYLPNCTLFSGKYNTFCDRRFSCVKIAHMSIKVIFMGSPEFALPVLQRLVDQYQVMGVVTQPDRPSGRGMVMTPPPIKELALELGLPVIQPNRMKDPGVFEQLQAWSPDVIVVAAFGKILRQNVLDLPRYGCINVHASYLPRWRGVAPIQAAIAAGDEFSGVSIMVMDAGIDTGLVLRQEKEAILPADTAETLGKRLAQHGADLLLDTLPGFIEGSILPQPQDGTQATYAPMLKKEDGLLDFAQSAVVLERRVRALYPWPGTFLIWSGQPLKVIRAHVLDLPSRGIGTRGCVGNLPAISCSQDWLVLDELQPAGKKAMPGEVFLRGARSWIQPDNSQEAGQV
jgi:methionyl-tRNA formyltransferase